MGARLALACLLLAVCLGGCRRARGETNLEPIDPSVEPEQQPLDPSEEPPPSELEGIPLSAQARYSIAARVLSRERYYRGWRSDISPLDLALGWGAMADPAVDRHIDWYQGGRWYFWQWGAGSPYQNDAIRRQSANVHIIPGNLNVRRALLALEAGDRIRLRGWLVSADGPNRDHWNTSLSRTDKGNHSCEIMYVNEVADDERVYR